MRMLLGALAVAALSSPVLAENWIAIDWTPHVVTAIDRDSVERSGAHIKFWMRRIFDVERRIGVFEGRVMAAANAQGATHFTEVRSLVDVDCRARTFARLAFRFYNREGRLVSQAAGTMEPVDFASDASVASGAELLCPKA